MNASGASTPGVAVAEGAEEGEDMVGGEEGQSRFCKHRHEMRYAWTVFLSHTDQRGESWRASRTKKSTKRPSSQERRYAGTEETGASESSVDAAPECRT
jgi:hypothetical protein